jgi:hypothetical protein
MTTRTLTEVPREAWVDRLNTFSIAHEGWLTSVAAFDETESHHSDIVDLPLIGVSADKNTADGTVVVSAERTHLDHVTRIIHGVRRVYTRPPMDGVTASLFIETADGGMTEVRVTAPARVGPRKRPARR